jgi:DNA ligase 1
MRCRDKAHLFQELERIEGLGGEGLMLRKPRSLYVEGRSSTLLKVCHAHCCVAGALRPKFTMPSMQVKTFQDAEAIVIGYTDGKGKHVKKTGALKVRMANGKTFKVGTG